MKGKIELDLFYGEKYYPLRKASHFVKWSQETAGIFKM